MNVRLETLIKLLMEGLRYTTYIRYRTYTEQEQEQEELIQNRTEQEQLIQKGYFFQELEL